MRLARELESQWKKVFLVHLPYIIPSGSGGLMVVGSFGHKLWSLHFGLVQQGIFIHWAPSIGTLSHCTFPQELLLSRMGRKKLPVQLIKYPIHPSFRYTTSSSIQVLDTPQFHPSKFQPHYNQTLPQIGVLGCSFARTEDDIKSWDGKIVQQEQKERTKLVF